MRIDKFLAEKFGSRTKAATAISDGLVLVNGNKVEPSYNYNERDEIEILQAEEHYVSAGGFKLAKALKDFGYSAEGKIFADIGASTGGFTDCLLQNGAKKVYCIDVGQSQLDKSLICYKTVIIDNFNARNLDKNLFSDKLNGVVIDVSFISLTYILNPVSNILDDGDDVLALIKPQFECETKKVGKNGIVRDISTRKKIINKIIDYAFGHGLNAVKITPAPIVQGKNIEYIIWLKKSNNQIADKEVLLNYVKL